VTFTVTSTTTAEFLVDQDVGSVGVAGSVSFSERDFTCRRPARKSTARRCISLCVQPLWGRDDHCASGQFAGGSGYVTTGVMIRETLNSSSANAKTADWTAFGGSILMSHTQREHFRARR